MNYKKYIAAVMALSMATGVAGCGSSSNSSSKAEDDFSATENVAVADTESIEAIPEGAEKEILYLGEGDINPTKGSPEKSTELQPWQASLNLICSISLCFDFVSKQKLPLDKSSFDVAVVGGVSDSVNCKAGQASAVLLNGRAYKVKTKIYLPRFVYAPVKSGDKIGLALFYYNDVEIARTDITAVEDAMLAEPEKPDIFHYYLDKLKKLFA